MDLYRRGLGTLVASWQAYAEGADGAAVHVRPGLVAAVFPAGPERSFYNNALLDGPSAVDALEEVYAAAGIARFAAWAHETDARLRAELDRRGYTVDTSTRAMGLDLAGSLPEAHREFGPGHGPDLAPDLGPASWPDYLDAAGLPAGLLERADHAAFHVLVARRAGVVVAAALAFDRDGDCGVYNVWTHPDARRHGLGTALTLAQLERARDRGCRSASLQATAMARRLYAAIGFHDLGRIIEYTPPSTVD